MSAPLVVLGATGSIGRQTLDVASRLDLPVVGLAARRGSDEFFALAEAHPDARIAVTEPDPADRDRFENAFGSRCRFGPDAPVELASRRGVTVVNGIVGAAGLRASVAALEHGCRLALANKESLVSGGPVVLAAARSGGGVIIPVDSEHSALFQCLAGEPRDRIRRLILTASGGPFFGADPESLARVTPRQALEHPTWSMGPRITIDSATLFNKGLEVIEAHHLFEVAYDHIDVVVHPQSIVHSLVEFVDGSVKAQLGPPDMRHPIQYALTYPNRVPAPDGEFSLAGVALTFADPDPIAFPALRIAYEAGRAGGSAPAVLNAADEVAIEAFLGDRIGFLDIAAIVERTLETVDVRAVGDVDDVLDADAEARAVASELVRESC